MLNTISTELKNQMTAVVKNYIQNNNLSSKYDAFNEEVVIEKLLKDVEDYMNNFELEDESEAIEKIEDACLYITELIDNGTIKF